MSPVMARCDHGYPVAECLEHAPPALFAPATPPDGRDPYGILIEEDPPPVVVTVGRRRGHRCPAGRAVSGDRRPRALTGITPAVWVAIILASVLLVACAWFGIVGPLLGAWLGR